MEGLEPDDKTICNFRTDNSRALRETFRAFTVMCRATDSAKFRAGNSRKNNHNRTTVQMEFKDYTAAVGYAEYIYANKDFWITIINGNYFIAAFNQNGIIYSHEVDFLNTLINGSKPFKERSPLSDGIKAMICFLGFGVVCSSVGFFGIKRNRRLKKVCTSQTTGGGH